MTSIFRRRRRVARALAVGLLTVGALPLVGVGSVNAKETFSFTRLAGADRFDTARVIADNTFTTADTVLIARGDGDKFADALAGNHLAGNVAGPILLTRFDSLPTAAKESIANLKAKNAIILGGTAAVSTAVENELKAIDSAATGGGKLAVSRIGGVDRYDTARLIATRAESSVGSTGGAKTAIIATGEKFPDALAGGPLAYSSKFPVLLVQQNALPAATRSAITALDIKHTLILGGVAAVSAGVESAIRTANGSVTVERLFGAERTATATKVADYALDKLQFSNKHVELALGIDFADALSGGPHGGKNKAPILLTSSRDTPGTATIDWLKAHAATLEDGHIFGGTAAITQVAENLAETAAGGVGDRELFTVTPANSGSGFASAPTLPSGDDNTGRRTCTAKLTDATTAVDIMLLPDSYVTRSTDTVTFQDTNNDNKADTTTTVKARIETINGTTQTTPGIYFSNVAKNSSGTVVFQIDSTSPDDVIAVVFSDLDNGDDLDLAVTTGTPNIATEPFGVGCHAEWVPPAAGDGPFSITVAGVDKTNRTSGGVERAGWFWSVGNQLMPAATFLYDASDGYQNETFSGIGLAGFERELSRGDSVSGNYDAAGSSSFVFQDQWPDAPTMTGTTETATGVQLTWTAPSGAGTAPNTLDGYSIYRCEGTTCTVTVTTDSVSASPQLLANVGPTITTYTDTTRVLGKAYKYAITAHADGDHSPASGTGDPAPIILEVSANGSSTPTVTTGDVHNFTFSEPMTSAAVNYAVSDSTTPTTNTATITCGQNGVSCAWGVTTLTVSFTQTPSTALKYPLTITSASMSDQSGNKPVVVTQPPSDRVIQRRSS